MDGPFLIVITGPPGAGKSTLAKRLARELRLPLISKDGIKETLFDTLGWRDREWSRMLGGASFDVLFHVLECQMEAGKSAVVETAFIPQLHAARFVALRDRYRAEPIQVLCRADEDTLFERFRERWASGERHPGHVDHHTACDQFRQDLRAGKYGPLEVGGLLLEVDTSGPDGVDITGVTDTIRDRMRPRPQAESAVVTRSALVDGLRQLGLEAGQVVMLHASVRALGWVVGGPDMILQAALDVLTPEGTLMMYAPWEEWERALQFGVRGFSEGRRRAYLEECPPFDPLRSRANREYSILTEYLRTWPGACRSDHPTASVVAVGARARWITERHPLAYGYGAGSPFDRLCQAGGKVLLLGSPLDRITLLHHAEHMARVPHKRRVHNTVPVLRAGQRVWVTFEEFDTCEGIRDRAPEEYFGTIAQEYLSSGAGRCGEVGAARAYGFDAAGLVRFAIQWMECVWGE